MQIIGQVLGTGVAAGGVLVQALEADRLQVARYSGIHARRRHRLCRKDASLGFRGRFAVERRPAREQLVQDGAERIDVHRRPDRARFAKGLLGCHVAGGAQTCPGGRELVPFFGGLRQAEVADLERIVPREEDVCGLY